MKRSRNNRSTNRGHEPLDTDSTPMLVGEHWLMHNGYAQAEGVANLDKVPETGGLVSIGAGDAPQPKSDKVLHYDAAAGMRVR